MKLGAAAIALAAIIAGMGSPALAALPASAAAPSPATISVAPAQFGDLRSGQPLRLFLTIDDPAGDGIAAGAATVSIGRTPFSSRASLASWFSGKAKSSLVSRVLTTADVAAVDPGLSHQFDITVPATGVKLGASGVYAVAVSVRSGGKTIGTARTAVAWKSANAKPVPIAIAAPLTVPAGDGGLISAKTLAADTASDGILTQELNDLASTQIAIGIDPRILASIAILGKSAPQSAIDWRSQLQAISNDTFPLAWGDADLTVALQAGRSTVPQLAPLDFAIQPSQFAPESKSTTAPTPDPTSAPTDPTLPKSTKDLVAWDYTLPQLSWPAENSIVSSDVAKLQKSGATSLIVSSSNLKQPASHSTLGATAVVGSTAIAVSDSGLSTYLRAAAQSTTGAGWSSAMTALTTTLDLISLESGAHPSAMLATFDRNWFTTDPDFAQTLDGVYSRPWVTEATLSSVTTAKPTKVTIADRPQSKERLALVHSMLSAEARVTRFSIVTAPDQQSLISTRRMILLALLSDEWLQDPTGWNTQAQSYVTGSDKILASISTVKSSTVTVLSDQVSLPLTVSNNLDQAVTVYVAVRPRTTLLSVDKGHRLQAVQIAANSQRRVEIPVQSVANGKVNVRVLLYSKSRDRIGTTTEITVNVQAGWETIGTMIFGALVVAIFALGIIRNIRKRRRVVRDSSAA